MTLKRLKQLTVFSGIICAALFVLTLILWHSIHIRSHQTEVVFLNIGQGDSILIKTPTFNNILIDGGPDANVLDRLGRNLAFYDDTIDMVIATHPDADHISGLIPVLDRYQVRHILTPGVVHTSVVSETLNQRIAEKHIPHTFADHRMQYDFSGVLVDVLYPFTSFVGRDIDDNNSASISVKVSDKEIDYLLTGDLPETEENELARRYGSLLDVEVFKAGHHGSRTSSGAQLLSVATPEVAVVSAGKNNKFGHPHQEVLDRLAFSGALILQTNEQGDIRLVSNGARFWLNP